MLLHRTALLITLVMAVIASNMLYYDICRHSVDSSTPVKSKCMVTERTTLPAMTVGDKQSFRIPITVTSGNIRVSKIISSCSCIHSKLDNYSANAGDVLYLDAVLKPTKSGLNRHTISIIYSSKSDGSLYCHDVQINVPVVMHGSTD